ncbi:MAG: hypothetical protein JRN20_22670 [Nitrososphaerota archaeon]|nr:hypothetical protein [Nitrososphaerota archaeon]
MTELRQNRHGRARPAKYYPRNLGFAKPPGSSVVEFLVVGRDEVGALSKILEVQSRHYLNLLSLNADRHKIGSEESFVVIFFADFSRSEVEIERIANEIRSLNFVKEVSWVRISQSIYDHFNFPLTMFGDIRFIAMRADSLLNIERRIIQEMGSPGASIMFQEGIAYAHQTTAQQMAMFPNVHPDVLLENNLEGLRATDWGIFEHAKSGNSFEISVKQLPFHSIREEGKDSSFQS